MHCRWSSLLSFLSFIHSFPPPRLPAPPLHLLGSAGAGDPTVTSRGPGKCVCACRPSFRCQRSFLKPLRWLTRSFLTPWFLVLVLWCVCCGVCCGVCAVVCVVCAVVCVHLYAPRCWHGHAFTSHLTPHTYTSHPTSHISHLTPHTYTSHPTPHTSHLTSHTSHLTPHTSPLTPHTPHLTSHTSHLRHSRGVRPGLGGAALRPGTPRRRGQAHGRGRVAVLPFVPPPA